MRELLREFAEFTPLVLMRLIADGATAILLFMPNVVGVVFYALAVGWMVDKVTSLAGSILVFIRTRQWVINSRIPIGTPRARIGFYLPMIAQNLLKAWIGFPVLYVLSLIFSDESGGGEELGRLVSGYHWQVRAIARIPLQTWLNFSHNSFLQVVISVAVAFFYLRNVYVFYADGFLLTKQIREASDLLLSIAVGAGEPNPTRERASAGLKGQGWPEEAVASALWFLFLSNLRIFSKNPAYNQIGPRQYGLFRAVSSLGVILALKALNPLVAAVKVYFEKQDIGQVRQGCALYQKHLARLPELVQARLKLVNLSGSNSNSGSSWSLK